MPTSGSADIPHVSIHDHYIHIPKKNLSSKKETKKTFLGLQAINDSLPDKNTKALAYIYQYEKFDAHEYYLDSAEKILNASSINDIKTYFTTLIHLYFCKKDYIRIIKIVQNIGVTEVLNTILNKTSYNNTHAWSSYRIGEAYYQAKQYKEAELFYNKSVNLAPYILDFRNKLAVIQMINQKISFAYQNWRFILKENPFFVSAYSNLGYAKMIINEPDSAWYYYQKGLKYDLFNEPLLMNVVAYFMQQKNTLKAKEYLLIILKQNPNHTQAKQLYEFINKKSF